jgi:hypothetical protein
MSDSELPDLSQLPTTGQINRATSLAALIAGALLVTVVMPNEYGVDPTGIGSVLGLKAAGDGKRAELLTEEPPATASEPEAAPAAAPGIKTGKVALTLQPGEGKEVKATMKAGEEFDFNWSTDGGEVVFDQHGEMTGGANDEFTSYEKGTKASASGKFRAPFDGTHGWYWKNRTDGPVTITVTATGTFEKFALKE